MHYKYGQTQKNPYCYSILSIYNLTFVVERSEVTIYISLKSNYNYTNIHLLLLLLW